MEPRGCQGTGRVQPPCRQGDALQVGGCPDLQLNPVSGVSVPVSLDGVSI